MASKENITATDDLNVQEMKKILQEQLEGVKEVVNRTLEEARETICQKLEEVISKNKVDNVEHAQQFGNEEEEGNIHVDLSCPPVGSVKKQSIPPLPTASILSLPKTWILPLSNTQALPVSKTSLSSLHPEGQLKRKATLINNGENSTQKKMAIQTVEDGGTGKEAASSMVSRPQGPHRPSGSRKDNSTPSTSASQSSSGVGVGSGIPAPKKILQFKVSMRNIKPPVWRRIQLLENATFYDLHVSIQRAFEWSGHHLHEFIMKKHTGQRRRLDYEGLYKSGLSGIHDIVRKCNEMNPYFIGGFRIPNIKDVEVQKQPYTDGNGDERYHERKTKLVDHFQVNELRCNYKYDFGSDWDHDVLLEKILPMETESGKAYVYPRLVGGRRVTPPEDDPGADFEYDASWNPSDVNMLKGPSDYFGDHEDFLYE